MKECNLRNVSKAPTLHVRNYQEGRLNFVSLTTDGMHVVAEAVRNQATLKYAWRFLDAEHKTTANSSVSARSRTCDIPYVTLNHMSLLHHLLDVKNLDVSLSIRVTSTL